MSIFNKKSKAKKEQKRLESARQYVQDTTSDFTNRAAQDTNIALFNPELQRRLKQVVLDFSDEGEAVGAGDYQQLKQQYMQAVIDSNPGISPDMLKLVEAEFDRNPHTTSDEVKALQGGNAKVKLKTKTVTKQNPVLTKEFLKYGITDPETQHKLYLDFTSDGSFGNRFNQYMDQMGKYKVGLDGKFDSQGFAREMEDTNRANYNFKHATQLLDIAQQYGIDVNDPNWQKLAEAQYQNDVYKYSDQAKVDRYNQMVNNYNDLENAIAGTMAVAPSVIAAPAGFVGGLVGGQLLGGAERAAIGEHTLGTLLNIPEDLRNQSVWHDMLLNTNTGDMLGALAGGAIAEGAAAGEGFKPQNIYRNLRASYKNLTRGGRPTLKANGTPIDPEMQLRSLLRWEPGEVWEQVERPRMRMDSRMQGNTPDYTTPLMDQWRYGVSPATRNPTNMMLMRGMRPVYDGAVTPGQVGALAIPGYSAPEEQYEMTPPQYQLVQGPLPADYVPMNKNGNKLVQRNPKIYKALNGLSTGDWGTKSWGLKTPTLSFDETPSTLNYNFGQYTSNSKISDATPASTQNNNTPDPNWKAPTYTKYPFELESNTTTINGLSGAPNLAKPQVDFNDYTLKHDKGVNLNLVQSAALKEDQYFVDKANKQMSRLGLSQRFNTRDDVREFQRKLGFVGNDVDGDFGGKTVGAASRLRTPVKKKDLTLATSEDNPLVVNDDLAQEKKKNEQPNIGYTYDGQTTEQIFTPLISTGGSYKDSNSQRNDHYMSHFVTNPNTGKIEALVGADGRIIQRYSYK